MRRRRSGAGAAGNEISLRPPGPADVLEIAALIENLSRRYLDQDLTAEGRAVIKAASGPGALGARWAGVVHPSPNPRFVAVDGGRAGGGRIVGYGAVRDRTHITQLFVAEEYQGRGIGHRLVRALAEAVRAGNPQAVEITLNSAPTALDAYLRMGFRPSGPRYVWRGIPGQPMAMPLPK